MFNTNGYNTALQAIQVYFCGGLGKWKAVASGGSCFYAPEDDKEEVSARKAAEKLAAKLGWDNEWKIGRVKDGSFVFVNDGHRIAHIHLHCIVYYDKTYGNTYSVAQLEVKFKNGEEKHFKSEVANESADNRKYWAYDVLEKADVIRKGRSGSISYYCYDHSIHFSSSISTRTKLKELRDV